MAPTFLVHRDVQGGSCLGRSSAVTFWAVAVVCVLAVAARCQVSPEPCEFVSETSSQTCTVNATSTAPTSRFDELDRLSPQFIVRFHSYKLAEDHRSLLISKLGNEGALWQWIARSNPAYQHPTDFGVLWLDPSHSQEIITRLNTVEDVHDVHADRKINRSLKSEDSTDDSSSQDQKQQHEGAAPETWGTGAAKQGDGNVFETQKAKGRLTTRPTWDLEENKGAEHGELRRSRFLLNKGTFTSMLGAEQLWQKGYTGKGVHVGVFDTGIRQDHPHLRNIKERTNWTHQDSLSDGLGHGTFVAGVIGGQDATCPGLAPDVLLHTFKVFTDDQVSYTSWFLDAFNYAMVSGVNVINLSIGGPDYLDHPFVDKVLEITSNGILLVSAIGNDGPLYGTLNNPADQNDVIGVGGIDYWDSIAGFSSRGMTTWELPLGYGRAKPDVMAYSRDVHGSRIQGGCRTLSGTSVASPVVAGAVCLLASTVPEEFRWQLLNPASMKQALVEGAVRLPKLNIYEQGAGRINLHNSHAFLATYRPRASLHPAALDFADCPYMWPFCRQPLYATSQPLIFNATVLNAQHVTGTFSVAPAFIPSPSDGGRHLRIHFEYSDTLWPWSGYLALFITVAPEGATFTGNASGTVTFTISSPSRAGPINSTVSVPLNVAIIPPPPRAKRLLFDQFHSMKYPPAYIPRDNLEIKTDILDWHGDHLHTNYHDMYNHLRDHGYYIETLGSPITCFNAAHYGALVLADSEEEYYPKEVAKLAADVQQRGLALLVFAEWYNAKHMTQMRFFDDNTRSWWTPITGGANVPALNDLLAPYNISLGDAVISGTVEVLGQQVQLLSGANIARFPAGGYLWQASMSNAAEQGVQGNFAAFGFSRQGAGVVAVLGDANCLDSSHQSASCFEFLVKVLDSIGAGQVGKSELEAEKNLLVERFMAGVELPKRRDDVNFTAHSLVLQHPLRCYSNSGGRKRHGWAGRKHRQRGRHHHKQHRSSSSSSSWGARRLRRTLMRTSLNRSRGRG